MTASLNLTYIRCIPGRAEPNWFNFVVGGISPLFLLCFGSIGICYSVYRLRVTKSKLMFRLIFLYSWDALLMVSAFGFYGLTSLFSNPVGVRPMNGLTTYLYRVCYPLVNLAMTGGVWTIVLISIERYIALSRPLHHHTQHRTIHSLLLRGMVTLGALLFTIPKFFELSSVLCWDGTEWHMQIGMSSLRTNKDYQMFYRVICNVVFVSPVPFIIICVVTVKTWIIRNSAVLRIRRNNRMLFGSTDWATVSLLALMVKFVVCQSCPTLLNAIELCTSQVGKIPWFPKLVEFSNFLIIFNCSTNWLIFSYLPTSDSERKLTRTEASVYRPSTSPNMLNEKQLKELRHIWQCEKRELIASQLMQAVTQANPLLPGGNFLTPTFTPNFASIPSNHDSKMGGLLDNLFKAALNGETFDLLTFEIIQASRAHAEHGVTMRNADWIVAKNYLIDTLLNSLTEEQKQWGNRLVTRVVAELKHGFIYGTERKMSAPLPKRHSVVSIESRKLSICLLPEEAQRISNNFRKRSVTVNWEPTQTVRSHTNDYSFWAVNI